MPSAAPARVASIQPGLYLGATATHACLLDEAGVLQCWGNNDHGQIGPGAGRPRLQPAPVPDLPPVAQVALGARHTCALLVDGSVRCWGDNNVGQLGPQVAEGRGTTNGLGEVRQLVAGANFTCALGASGEVRCWGALPPGGEESATPQLIHGLVASRLAAASRAVCAVRTTGAVACWGHNDKGNVSPGGPAQVTTPTDVKDTGEAIDVALSDQGTCVMRKDAKIACWGGLEFSPSGPSTIWAIEDPVAITAGASGHFCGLSTQGQLRCWGEDRTGAGGGRYAWRGEIGAGFLEVRAGYNFSCGRTRQGEVRCWGTNDQGQLARSFDDALPRPTRLEEIEGARRVAASSSATCAVLADRSVRCWGPAPQVSDDNDGKPRSVPSLARADDLVMGGSIECAFTDKLPTCWGDNRANQLPSQNSDPYVPPSTLASLGGLKALAFGREHACSLSAEGAVSCWGGPGKTRAAPTPLKNLTAAEAIALGADEGCALLGDGTAACWPLGGPAAKSAPAGSRFAPVKVAGVRGATAIAHGERHACAVLASGGVTCWGRGDGGALGRAGGPDERDAAAAPVEGVSDAVELALGDGFSCARRRDGAVACWGKNERGQLGDGSFDSRPTPRPVEGLSDVTLLRAGASHACALNRRGEILCWGDNRLRQIQPGPTLISRAPVIVTFAASGPRNDP